jgi:isoleucyl-tRNA synthetase
MKFKEPQNKTIVDFEADVSNFWNEHKVFEKSVNERSADNLYIFYDGPPFISGLPHYGHLLGSIAKDIIPRYWTMKGKRVERVWGWDAHGLTVENKVQKELNIPNRRDIENYGLDRFTQACYEYTSRISGEWKWYIDKIGRWVDMENAYKTIDQNYMESVMWAFKQLYDKGLIYEGTRTSLYCTTCGTPVSNFEIAMDNSYKDMEDPAVTVKFKVIDGKFKDAYILAWTTTPWTLPSNRALVVNPNEHYKITEYNGEKYLVAETRSKEVFKNIPDYELGSIPEETMIMGKELVGLEYEPLYWIYGQIDEEEKEFRVYADSLMANVEEGTGIVHCAPGFGEVDTEVGGNNGLKPMQTIDDEGHFVDFHNVSGEGFLIVKSSRESVEGETGSRKMDGNFLSGLYFKKADKYIMEDLEKRGLMFKNEKIVHRFPYHDRCNTRLIQKAQSSWFVRISQFKDQLLKNNENINWMPEHLKQGRFAQGIEQAPDWCVSRTRFWATPMPVWESADGDRIVVSSVKEIEDLSGQKVKDLHRPYIDEIVLKKDGKEYKRRPEVLDSWFEAGSMPYAQVHYPFENEKKFKENYPGDYIVEYIGQVRAWFYVMHVLSTALFGSNSFRNVISTGIMAGNDGRKMSKTYGNYADPKEILNTVGGDALRLYLMNSPLMVGNNANFDDNELRNKSRNVLNPLWNSAKFFLIYANLNNWDVSQRVESENVLDKWILGRLNSTVKLFAENIEAYNVPKAVEPIEAFVDDLSNWFVRRSRDRISDGDKEALSTLYEVLVEFSKAAAPIMPFISENIYQHLKTDEMKESVHLESYPLVNEKYSAYSKSLDEDMILVRKICSVGSALRKEHNVPVRQPLMEIVVVKDMSLTSDLFELIKDELNVKEVKFSTSSLAGNYKEKGEGGLKVQLNMEINEELEVEGYMREFIREVQKARKDAGVAWDAMVKVEYKPEEKYKKALSKFEKEIKDKTLVENFVIGEAFKVI